MKKIIITASDEKYSPVAMGMLRSLYQWNIPLCDTVGLLDLGLSAATRRDMMVYAKEIVEPDWDFPVSESIKREKPHVRALLARPLLRKYFPGYDLYLWLDADMWVQERFAIDWFFAAAGKSAMGLVPSADRSYVYHATHLQWRRDNLFAYFGKEALQLYDFKPYYNAGAYSLRADAPHWEAWAKYFIIALQADPRRTCDQAVLNYALWKENLAVHPLPSLCNWLCHYAIPQVNPANGRLHEPHIPHRPLGIVHMAAKSKTYKMKFSDETRNGEFDLHYEGRKIFQSPQAYNGPATAAVTQTG